MRSRISKICRVCGRVKRGHEFPFGMDHRAERCKSCERTAKLNARMARQSTKAKPRPNQGAQGRAYLLVQGAKLRARKRGLAFDLDEHVDELQRRMDAGRCEMSGVPLVFVGGRGPTSPSLDRIDPSKGYVYDNVRVVCWAMNAALGTWGDKPLRTIMASWLGAESGTIAPVGAENGDKRDGF